MKIVNPPTRDHLTDLVGHDHEFELQSDNGISYAFKPLMSVGFRTGLFLGLVTDLSGHTNMHGVLRYLVDSSVSLELYLEFTVVTALSVTSIMERLQEGEAFKVNVHREGETVEASMRVWSQPMLVAGTYLCSVGVEIPARLEYVLCPLTMTFIPGPEGSYMTKVYLPKDRLKI